MRTSECRSCGAPIIWAITKRGKAQPIDAVPCTDGNRRLTGRTMRTRAGGHAPECEVVEPTGELFALDQLDEDGAARYMAHHATCPDADAWRDLHARAL